MSFHQHTLANGLTLLGETIPASRSVAVSFYVRTGSRDELPSESGVSHFLEHMMFKGTPTRSAAEVNLAFDRIGASDHTNASTGEETTEYYTAVLPEYLPAAVDVLADMLRPSLRDEDFGTEKQVILEEIKMYEDSPGAMAWDYAKERYYAGHPLGNSILGTTASITALSRDRMQGYYDRRYVGPNMIAVAAGNFDWDHYVELIGSLCARWPATPAGRSNISEPPGIGGVHLLSRPDATQQHMLVMMPAPAADSPLRYAAGTLALAVGDYTGSRLYWQLVDPGLVESASFLTDFNHGAGLAAATFSGDPDTTAANLAVVQKVLADVQRDGITADELTQAQNKITSRIVRYAERPSGRMRAIAGAWLATGEYADVDRELGRYEAVTLDDVRAYLDRYPITASTVVGYGPVTSLN